MKKLKLKKMIEANGLIDTTEDVINNYEYNSENTIWNLIEKDYGYDKMLGIFFGSVLNCYRRPDEFNQFERYIFDGIYSTKCEIVQNDGYIELDLLEDMFDKLIKKYSWSKVLIEKLKKLMRYQLDTREWINQSDNDFNKVEENFMKTLTDKQLDFIDPQHNCIYKFINPNFEGQLNMDNYDKMTEFIEELDRDGNILKNDILTDLYKEEYNHKIGDYIIINGEIIKITNESEQSFYNNTDKWLPKEGDIIIGINKKNNQIGIIKVRTRSIDNQIFDTQGNYWNDYEPFLGEVSDQLKEML